MDSATKVVLVIVGSIIAVGILIAIGYQVDIHIVQPAARQDQLSNPNTTIALRKDFHNKLTEVLTADSNIVSLAQKMQTENKTTPGYSGSQQYQDDLTNLTDLMTIRTHAISGYNEQAQSTDTRAWNDICMPRSIANTTLDQADLNSMVAQVLQEEKTLTAKDGVC